MIVNLKISLSSELDQRLKEAAQIQHKSEQELVSKAVENHLGNITIDTTQTCYELLENLGILAETQKVCLPSETH